MKGLSIKGIVLGIVSVLIVDVAAGISMVYLFSGTIVAGGTEALGRETAPLIFSLFTGTLSTVLGGYVAARLGKEAPYKNSLVIGVAGFGSGFLFLHEYPVWFNLFGFATVIPAALFGGYLVARKNA